MFSLTQVRITNWSWDFHNEVGILISNAGSRGKFNVASIREIRCTSHRSRDALKDQYS